MPCFYTSPSANEQRHPHPGAWAGWCVLAVWLLAGQLAHAQSFTYVAGQSLGLFESRQLRQGESLYIPAGVVAWCDFQVVGSGVRIVNDGEWHPSQSALEMGAVLVNNGSMNALFMQVNDGQYINKGNAAYYDFYVGPAGHFLNDKGGFLLARGSLLVAGTMQNCGQLSVPNNTYVLTGTEVPCSSGPLPVTLVSFTARSVGRGVLVEWTVGSELGSDRYEVERSADGLLFALVGTVPARGASDYSYTDKASPGAVYYRLRSVDTDGSAAYSPVVALAGAALARLSYYNELGQVLAGPIRGFYVEVSEYENGAVERKKYVEH